VVDAFIAAARAGDFHGLLAVLDPDVVLRADVGVLPRREPGELRGARAVARSAVTSAGRFRTAPVALVLVNGVSVGAVVAPRGRLSRVLIFKLRREKIVGIDVVADPARLRQLDLAVLMD
jgi:RNA polymerase sigma-70 factor, ECF subfamily